MELGPGQSDGQGSGVESASAGAAPSRLMARFVAEVQFAATMALVNAIEPVCGPAVVLDRVVVLMVVMRTSADLDRVTVDAASVVVADDQAISVNRIAASLGRPFETIRRHVNALVAAGICKRTPHGITMATDLAALPSLQHAARELHDLMVLLVAYARANGVVLPTRRPARPYRPIATIATMLDLLLSAVEYLDPHYEDWLEGYVVNAAMAANARPITLDPVLAHRYDGADTVPPQTLRQPVSIANIARALRIPYSTVQRQISRSIARGQLHRVSGGIMVTPEQIEAAAVRIAGPAALARAMRAFGRLVAGGFPFDDPAGCYLDGEPCLLDFGDGVPSLDAVLGRQARGDCRR